MKHILFASLSVLALSACTTMEAVAKPPAQKSVAQKAPLKKPPQPIKIDTGPYHLMTDAEIADGMPVLADGGDQKAYVASFIDWLLTPGHMIARSTLLSTGAPSGFPDAGEFSSLIGELADDGNAAAKVFSVVGTADDLAVLQQSPHPMAAFFLQMRQLNQGSLQQKIDALAWLRKEAETNTDAAFALGGFLIDQGAMPDSYGARSDLLATPAEIEEGTKLLKRAALSMPLQPMIHISDLLEQSVGTAQGDPTALRQILELTVAATSTTATENAAAVTGISTVLGETDGFDAVYRAANLRISLAQMLEAGKGGPADVERAKTLYLEALQATNDTVALKALKRLGVDVKAYEPPDDLIKDGPSERGDALEDQ